MKTIIEENQNQLKDATFIDLFSGVGAFHTALSSFGASCVFACDIDNATRKVYEENYGITPEQDITKIRVEDIPAHDFICAGFPCQPFSIAGKQAGFADKVKGTLFYDVVRIIEYHHPAVVLLENVKNLVKHDGGKTFKTIKSTLEKLGYDVYYKVLNAADYGVPQARERVFIVAFRKNLEIHSFSFPAPMPLKKHLIDLLEPDSATKEFIIPSAGASIRPITEVPTDKPLRLGEFTPNSQGNRIYSPAGTSITLMASGFGRGGHTGIYRVNGVLRTLTPRECARCTGFPETFILPKSKTTAWRLFGNSIVVDVIQAIIEEIVKAPEIKNYINKKENN